jgi:hypothetical protein
MCCARSYFRQIDLFHRYSKQTLYFYSLIQMVYTEYQKIPLSSICGVLNLLVIFPTLLRMPSYQFCIPRVREHTFQMINHWKVSHHQGRNLSLLILLHVGIIFIINTLKTNSSLLILHSVNIHMIVTSLVYRLTPHTRHFILNSCSLWDKIQ